MSPLANSKKGCQKKVFVTNIYIYSMGEKIDHLRRGTDVSPLSSMIAGSFSGLVARCVTAPLDIVKIRLQLKGNPNNMQYGRIVGTLREIVKYEGGVRALWKGNVPAGVMYVIYGATEFTTYSMLNSYLFKLNHHQNHPIYSAIHSLTVGAIAGVTSTSISYPFDVLRTRLAFSSESHFLPLWKTAHSIAHNEGVHGFFGGIKPSLLSVAMNTGIMFCSYEGLRLLAEAEDFAFVEPVCGLLAGGIAKLTTYPLDLIRRRLQVLNKRKVKMTMKTLIESIMLTEGPRGFYRGVVPAVAKSAPTTAVSIWMYEFALNELHSIETKALA